MSQPLPLQVVGRPHEHGSNVVEAMFDSSATFWCSPPGSPLPQVVTFGLYAPAWIEQVLIDPRVPGYEACGPRDVRVEVAPANNPEVFVTVGQAAVAYGQISAVPVHPSEARAVRVSFLSTYGGPCVAVTELRVMGTPSATHAAAATEHRPRAEPIPRTVVDTPSRPAVAAAGDAHAGAMAQAAGAPVYARAPLAPVAEVRPLAASAPAQRASVPSAPAARATAGDAAVASAPVVRARAAGPPAAQAVAGTFKQGARVMAVYVDGRPYPGKVMQFDGAQYEIEWEHEVPPSWVAAAQVRAR
jgi:hypothetical protein